MEWYYYDAKWKDAQAQIANDRVERLAVFDCVPILEALERADARFAEEWWHWFFFATEHAERVICADPLAWYHFKGDSGSVSFKAIIFIPSSIPDEFWQSAKNSEQDVRLMVKRVFITNDLGEHKLPKWISWLKVIVDGGHFFSKMLQGLTDMRISRRPPSQRLA